MQTYTFRPYFAHDCDSEQGFNNGYYLDEVTVTAPDETTARSLALTVLSERFDFDTVDADETQQLDVDAAWTHGHIWRSETGDEYVSEPDDPDATCSYLYQFLDLGEPDVSWITVFND